MKKSTRILCILLIVLGALNFGAFFVHTHQLGGDALNGRQANGRYYVRNKSVETEVSQQQWQLSKWHALSLFLTHPVGLGALLLLLFKDAFPKKVFRGDAEQRELAVAQIRGAGPLTTRFGCAGKIGELSFSAGLIKIEIYAEGFVGELRFIGEFGVWASEIQSVEKQATLLHSGILIVHRAPNVVSPILLRCASDHGAVRALLSLGNRDIH